MFHFRGFEHALVAAMPGQEFAIYLKPASHQDGLQLLPLAQVLNVSSRTIAQPAVQLGGIFELLSAQPWDHQKTTVELRE
jgi:hypothetical protein